MYCTKNKKDKILSNCAVFLKMYRIKGSKVVKCQSTTFTRRMYFDLPHMSITPILMIANNGDLYHKRPYRSLIHIFNRYQHPT